MRTVAGLFITLRTTGPGPCERHIPHIPDIKVVDRGCRNYNINPHFRLSSHPGPDCGPLSVIKLINVWHGGRGDRHRCACPSSHPWAQGVSPRTNPTYSHKPEINLTDVENKPRLEGPSGARPTGRNGATHDRSALLTLSHTGREAPVCAELPTNLRENRGPLRRGLSLSHTLGIP